MERGIRRARLLSGLVLLAFVTTHLLNTALALLGLLTAEAARPYMMGIWYQPAGFGLLALSAVAHSGLGLWSLYQRHSLRMPKREAVQLVTGLAIPILLAGHVIGTRGAFQAVGLDVDYVMMMVILWGEAPLLGLMQVILVVVAWEHAKIGLYGWLNLRPWWPKVAFPANVIAVAIPIFALLGFVEGGIEARQLLHDPAILETLNRKMALAQEFMATAQRIESNVVWGWICLVAGVLAARWIRMAIKERGRAVIHHTDGPVLRGRPGQTLLEASRANGVPHAAVCGGRGRCGTCRILVIEGAGLLSTPGRIEAEVLRGLGNPASVRLACQAQIAETGSLTITRLLPAYAEAQDAVSRRRSRRLRPSAAPVEASK